jgi:Na+:H+ antiporter, NhaA family
VKLTKLFTDFTSSEKSGGIFLIIFTFFSLLVANSPLGKPYIEAWHFELFSHPIEFWINDGLMTIFFLLVGLEIEREIYIGELHDIKKSLLPVFAALGGMLVPALIHFAFNNGQETAKGFGIPMATDIAFSLAVLSLLGNRVPASLKVFLTALAIIDDLGAIIIIAIFYSSQFELLFFCGAMGLMALMFALNRLKIYHLWIYLFLGMLMWVCMYKTGIHPTITGVLLAFVIPFGKGDEASVSYKLQHRLHLPVAFIILPLFAMANTAIVFSGSLINNLSSDNSLGIIYGLVFGKPIGIFLFSMIGIALGWCSLPAGLKKRHLLYTGFLGGIGFTMSIFISLLAFTDHELITNSIISIMLASVISGLLGYLALMISFGRAKEANSAQ